MAAAIARMSSQMGLPLMTPQVALGSSIVAAARCCSSSVVVEPGEPRHDAFRAAAEAGEEVRLDEARDDTHVGLDPSTVQVDRHVPDHAHVDEVRPVARVVIDDVPQAEDLVAEHGSTLIGRRSTVRPGRDQHDHVLRPDDTVEDLHDRLQHQRARLRPRHVADGDRDALAGANDVAKTRTGHRAVDGLAQRRGGSVAAVLGCGVITVVAAVGKWTVNPVDP